MKNTNPLKPSLLLATLLMMTLFLQTPAPNLVETVVAQEPTIPLPEPMSITAPASSDLIIMATTTDTPAEPVLAPALSRSLNAIQTANIQVNYINKASTWDTQPGAQAAFQHAVDIWATLISSSKTIVVDAYWEDLSYISPNVLGAAGATTIHANNGSFPYPNTWYPAALANALSNSDINGGDAEIKARFNSSFSSWYFGTDNNTPFSQYNFASVVLHEIGHGLGFFGSMRVDNGSGNIECRGINGEGCWGYSSGSNIYPIIYDRFTENAANTALINTGSFPNPSVQLRIQLTSSNNIYFDATNATSTNGSRVPLYAPTTWSQGSSYSHLAESFNNTQNALMTYSLTNGETNYDPGPVALAMFKDMGWSATLPPVYQPPQLTQLPGQLLGINTQHIDAINVPAYTILEPGFVYDLAYQLTDSGDANAGISFNGVYISISPQTGWTGQTTATMQVKDLNDPNNQISSSTFTVVVADPIYNVYLPAIMK